MPNEALLTRTLVELADSLGEDFDVVDLLTLLADRCVGVVNVAAAGLMLASADGELRVLASSSEAMRVLELFEAQADEGPCIDAYRSGQPVVNVTIDDAISRWPRSAPKAAKAGFRSIHALPVGLRGESIGALNCSNPMRGSWTTPTWPPRRPWPPWPLSPSWPTEPHSMPRSETSSSPRPSTPGS